MTTTFTDAQRQTLVEGIRHNLAYIHENSGRSEYSYEHMATLINDVAGTKLDKKAVRRTIEGELDFRRLDQARISGIFNMSSQKRKTIEDLFLSLLFSNVSGQENDSRDPSALGDRPRETLVDQIRSNLKKIRQKGGAQDYSYERIAILINKAAGTTLDKSTVRRFIEGDYKFETLDNDTIGKIYAFSSTKESAVSSQNKRLWSGAKKVSGLTANHHS